MREERVLNRVIRATEEGWKHEPHQRHADQIIQCLGLGEAKGVNTPEEDTKACKKHEGEQELIAQEIRDFRGLAARANYLAMDRPDIQHASEDTWSTDQDQCSDTSGGRNRQKWLDTATPTGQAASRLQDQQVEGQYWSASIA